MRTSRRASIAVAGIAVALATSAVVLRGPRPAARLAANALVPLVPLARAEEPLPAPSPLPPKPASAALPAPRERADAHLVRSWRAPLAGGLLTFPPSFASEDGRYDLIIHLNGNTDLVEESYGYAGVNAVVMILNLGVGSGVYEDRFADPAAFSLILDRVQSTLVERGLRTPKLGRVAVSGWSSGYGGVIKLLQHDAIFDRIDAVVLFDSIHCGIEPWSGKLKADQIEPIRRFAQKAVEGRALLSITHSEIETYGYTNAHKTTDAVLATVGMTRRATAREQPMPLLRSMVGVLPKRQMRPLAPLTEAHRGGLHVRGYDGNGPITHMLHLVQMSTTALPDLVAYWGASRPDDQATSK
ncbi:Hypothetical protein A7982_03990 [Minicystis rosea]|nr:Hypothetical protein A7982_03990 [Minicystis rosea]